MASHAASLELNAFVEGALSAKERRLMAKHLEGCVSCRNEVQGLRRLEALIDSLPPTPPSTFTPFWLKLRARLPQPRTEKAPLLRPRLVFALAAAVVTALTLSSAAFAAESALPDSPLYGIKEATEQVELSLARTPKDRADVELRLATVRLQEASAMAGVHRGDLAAEAIDRFNALLERLGPQLPASAKENFDLQIEALTLFEGQGRGDGQVLSSIKQAENELERQSSDKPDKGQGNPHAHPTPHPHQTPDGHESD
jgi:hypothetical protein